MKDYGYYYRQQFLSQERIDKSHRRQCYWLLGIAFVYFGGHLVHYLMR